MVGGTVGSYAGSIFCLLLVGWESVYLEAEVTNGFRISIRHDVGPLVIRRGKNWHEWHIYEHAVPCVRTRKGIGRIMAQ